MVIYSHKTQFLLLTLLGLGSFLIAAPAEAQKDACSINWNLFTCQPASFSQPGKTAAELREEERLARIRAEKAAAARRAKMWPTEFVKISKDMKNPNSVKIPFAQAPGISAETRRLDGRRVCAGSLKTGKKSKQDKDVHIDRECCLDKDEIPNPRCYYPQLGDQNAPERVTGPDGKKYIK